LYKKISTIIYFHAYKFLLWIWGVFSIIAFIFSNYYSCISPYKNLYGMIALISIITFVSLTLIMLFHLLLYKDDSELMMDKENTESVSILDGGPIKYFVIPIYALMIFSISKILISITHYNPSNDYALMIWIALLIGFGIYWFIMKGKAHKSWDLKLSIIVGLYTIIVIFWESTFLPFTKSLLKVGECVNHKIIELKIDDTNESIYNHLPIIK